MGLFRVVCTNGLIVSKGAFPAYCVSHRGNVVDEVIEAALKVSEQFETLAVQVERMEQRRVMKDEQLRFAERALATASNRSLVASKWRRNREVFAVSYGGRTGYPVFQFDPITARPNPAIAKIIAAFPVTVDGWRLA